MKIVHVIARLNLGGAANQVLELAAGQQRHGHDVVVLHGRIPEGEESMVWRAEELGLHTIFVSRLQRELSLTGDLGAVRAIRRALRSLGPDVLHTHAAKAGATARLAALAGGSAAVRVHTFHGHVLRGYFDRRRERVFTLVERGLARRTSALVVPSAEVRDDLVRLGVAAEERFVVIPYGFQFPDGSAGRERLRGELGVNPAAFVVGFAGRLTDIKRPLDLVRVLQLLRSQGIDAFLVAVGDGPERPAVEQLATSLGVEDRCRLVGYRTDIWDFYAAFDALCLTSANEGTPVAAIEALAAGRPVVATRVGGVPTVMDDGETGLLAEAGDVELLAAHLARLAEDEQLRSRMGALGAERMRERFGLDRMVSEHEELYRRLLG